MKNAVNTTSRRPQSSAKRRPQSSSVTMKPSKKLSRSRPKIIEKAPTAPGQSLFHLFFYSLSSQEHRADKTLKNVPADRDPTLTSRAGFRCRRSNEPGVPNTYSLFLLKRD